MSRLQAYGSLMKLPRVAALFVAALSCLAATVSPAWAQGQFDKPKYASIVVDANSGEVLYALHADDARYPASITKVMTLYLTFEALATGRLSLDDRVPFSPHAASQGPSKLGVPAGQDISVSEAIQAAAVMSANDAAVALAEKIGAGSEQRFAALMTLRGQELGMKRTRFLNANGLPAGHQDVNVSTARDIAVLSRAVMRDYPQYYHFFNQHAFTWRGRTTLNHNRLLLRMVGMDGLKTGYTNAAGFNLAASAVRDGRRLITVVLGGSSSAARNENVETLLQAGFDVLDRRSHGQTLTLASLLSEPEDGGALVRPALEMGSGEQGGLQVVTADTPPAPPARPMQMARIDAPPPALRFAPAAPMRAERRVAAPKVAQVCEDVVVRHGRHRVREARCRAATAAQVLASAPDCRHLQGRSLRTCREDVKEAHEVAREASAGVSAPDCTHLRGRRLKACRSEARAEPQVAVTAPPAFGCAKVRGRKDRAACRAQEVSDTVQTARVEAVADCAKVHGRKAHAACKASGSDEARPETAAKAEGGAYMIQVGAFGSRKDAESHLSKLSGLVGGSEKVESAGHAYRARFAGLSKAEARTACARLSAKGERCMVVAH